MCNCKSYAFICCVNDSYFHQKHKWFCANRRCKTRMTRWASSFGSWLPLSERAGPPSPLRLDSLVVIMFWKRSISEKAHFKGSLYTVQIVSKHLYMRKVEKCGQLCPAQNEILACLFRVHELVPLRPVVTALAGKQQDCYTRLWYVSIGKYTMYTNIVYKLNAYMQRYADSILYVSICALQWQAEWSKTSFLWVPRSKLWRNLTICWFATFLLPFYCRSLPLCISGSTITFLLVKQISAGDNESNGI